MNSTEANTTPTPASPPTPTTPLAPKPPTSWLKRHKLVVIITALVLLLGGGGVLAWNFVNDTDEPMATKPSPSATPSATPKPTTKLSPLTGVPVAPELADRPIVSVIIENHPAARPQSGLADAGVVYEALAEGGITRFQSFFLDARPGSIGPVRSLRPYFIDWGLEFNAPVAHAGGSATALNLVKPTGLKSMNALNAASSGFYRIGGRVAPHNLYTNADRLDALLGKFGYNQPANFTVSPRKADTPTTTPSNPNIRIQYSSAGYEVAYQYDPATNDYGRTLAGAPHVDSNTGKQIRVKNVVIEMMPSTTLADGHVQMQTVGQGKGWVMRDGGVVPCTWTKSSPSARTKLIDATGAEIPLNAGNTWYSIVPVGKTVSF